MEAPIGIFREHEPRKEARRLFLRLDPWLGAIPFRAVSFGASVGSVGRFSVAVTAHLDLMERRQFLRRVELLFPFAQAWDGFPYGIHQAASHRNPARDNQMHYSYLAEPPRKSRRPLPDG